jgi:uncharacterized cupin superfamily protein
MKKVKISDLPWVEFTSPSGKYQCRDRDISLALGGKKDTGTWGGGHPFDLGMCSVPPGASVCPYHSHTTQWELFVVLKGEATVRSNDEKHTVREGDSFIQPPGTAHQITNTGTEDFVFYVIADNPLSEICHYPDSNKWAINPQRKVFRMTEVDYFDGED